MAANYITSAEQTMILVRRIAAHLAVEPYLPAPEDLTRGEVDAWIRALNTGIHSRVIDLLALPVLECLLYMRGRNLGCKTKHLRRGPSEMFRPVVVNPWVREDVVVNREHLPWIPGDRIVEIVGSHDDVEDIVDTEGQAVIVHHGDDVEADFTNAEEEGTQLENTQLKDTQHDGTQQNVYEDDGADDDTQLNGTEQQADEDDSTALPSIEQTAAEQDSALQNTEQSVVETDSDPLPQTTAVKSNYLTRSKAVQNADVTMKDAPEHDDSSQDDPDQIYCICNDTVGGTMVQCDNYKDNDCKGKWFHLKCAGLPRSPAKNVHWYCMDCRKKLGRGLFTSGVVR